MFWLRASVLVVLLAQGSLLLGCESSEGGAAASTAAASSKPTSPPPSATASALAAAPTSSASAAPKAAATPVGMVKIAGSIYLMGAFESRGNPEERPGHEAITASYFMDLTEVTVDAYRKCVKAGACTNSRLGRRFCNEKMEGRGKHPINCVTLHQAAAYCTWAGKRLPSEREWEHAASNGAERRRFSWGGQNPDKNNCCYHHPYGSCDVASYAAGAFGLFDMTGNVWEWTQTKFGAYPSRPTIDPISAKHHYVYRGGSWSRRFPKWMRNILRNRYKPDRFSAAIGMRCAKSVVPLECPKDTKNQGGKCVRVRGKILCEPGYRWVATRSECIPDALASSAYNRRAAPNRAATSNPSQLGIPQAGPSAQPVAAAITRTRTPKWDADCKKNWPKTPAAYLFKGGQNYPSRKPAVQGGGCQPRDMGWTWTSACCPG